MLRQLFIAIKTFVFLQRHARKIALVLDDCLRAMGQMNHPHSDTQISDAMLMKTTVRAELIDRGAWRALPRWKWRND